MDRLKMPEGEAIEAGMVTRSIEKAQRKVEGRNFDIRKQLLEYDDVANEQRKVIYQQRNDILDSPRSDGHDRRHARGLHAQTWCASTCRRVDGRAVGPACAGKGAGATGRCQLTCKQQVAKQRQHHRRRHPAKLRAEPRMRLYQAKVELVGTEHFMHFERAVLLQSFDTNWRDHLSALDYLRQGIHLRGYAQKQPKQEYKREAFEPVPAELIDASEERSHPRAADRAVQSATPEPLDEAAAPRCRGTAPSSSSQHALHRPPTTGEAGPCRATPAAERPRHARRARRPQRPLPVRQSARSTSSATASCRPRLPSLCATRAAPVFMHPSLSRLRILLCRSAPCP